MSSKNYTATEKWLEDIRLVQNNIDMLDIPEAYRKTIFRCLCSEFEQARERLDELTYNARSGRKWTDEDLNLLRTILAKHAAPKTWAQERMIVVELATNLHRPEKVCKKKAIELGLAAKVDYWSNPEVAYDY